MTYRAFGLGLWTNAPVPRLAGAPEASRIDLRIWLAARPIWFGSTPAIGVWYASRQRDESGRPVFLVSEHPGGWLHVEYSDGFEFTIDRSGSEIWATWPDHESIDDACSYLLGPIMGLVLRLRGHVALHASAVVADGAAFALIGEPGAGKSTTAAAFAVRGHALLSDDLVPLEFRSGTCFAGAGYPRVRLWPASVAGLSALGSSMPALPPDFGNRRYHLNITQHGFAFQTAPLPLRVVYVLNTRQAEPGLPAVQPLHGHARLLALVTHSFCNVLLDREMRAFDFDMLARVANHVPVRVVTPPDTLARLPQLCDAILQDFRAAADQQPALAAAR